MQVLGLDHHDTLTSKGNLVWIYRSQGRWKDAEGLEVQVMETRKRTIGLDHPSTLTSMDNLPSTYRQQGRWNGAEKLEVQGMETSKWVLGPDYTIFLTFMDSLASTWKSSGKCKDALLDSAISNLAQPTRTLYIQPQPYPSGVERMDLRNSPSLFLGLFRNQRYTAYRAFSAEIKGSVPLSIPNI